MPNQAGATGFGDMLLEISLVEWSAAKWENVSKPTNRTPEHYCALCCSGGAGVWTPYLINVQQNDDSLLRGCVYLQALIAYFDELSVQVSKLLTESPLTPKVRPVNIRNRQSAHASMIQRDVLHDYVDHSIYGS